MFDRQSVAHTLPDAFDLVLRVEVRCFLSVVVHADLFSHAGASALGPEIRATVRLARACKLIRCGVDGRNAVVYIVWDSLHIDELCEVPGVAKLEISRGSSLANASPAEEGAVGEQVDAKDL